MTREEENAKQRASRAKNGNAATKKYEKTKKGFLMRLYRNIQSRVTGVQRAKYHLYSHITDVIGREDFYAWAMSSPEFHSLFASWEKDGYGRRLTPSVDRVDSKGGYAISNMEWVTHSENSRRSSRTRMENKVR